MPEIPVQVSRQLLSSRVYMLCYKIIPGLFFSWRGRNARTLARRFVITVCIDIRAFFDTAPVHRFERNAVLPQ